MVVRRIRFQLGTSTVRSCIRELRGNKGSCTVLSRNYNYVSMQKDKYLYDPVEHFHYNPRLKMHKTKPDMMDG